MWTNPHFSVDLFTFAKEILTKHFIFCAMVATNVLQTRIECFNMLIHAILNQNKEESKRWGPLTVNVFNDL